MTTSQIGHNNGPSLQADAGWRKYCWTRARKNLIGKTVPIEIVRMRIKRARELSLSYPQYASVMLGTGRDIVVFLFTVDGLQLKLRRKLEMPHDVQMKLQGIEGCDLISFAASGEDAKLYRNELVDISGVPFVSSPPEPDPCANWKAAHKAVHTTPDPLKLPSDAVVMIGAGKVEKRWAAAGNIARFIPTADYFNNSISLPIAIPPG